MPHIRKAVAGNDSFGNEWAKAGAVVEVPYEQAVALLAIPDGGFTEVDASPETETEPEPDPAVEPEPEPEPEVVEEPAPEPDNPVDEAPKPRQTRGRKPKTVEE